MNADERDITSKKVCRDCKVEKNTNEFNKNKSRKDGFGSECTKCHKKYRMQYRMSDRGLLVALLGSVRGHDKKSKLILNKTDRYNTIEEILEMSKGGCYYSGISMTLRHHSDWQFSLERLDNNRPHVDGNVVAICLEFQNRQQWSRNKVAFMRAGAHNALIINENSLIKSYKKRVYKKVLTRENDGFIQCFYCDTFRSSTEYQERVTRGCSSCRAENIIKYQTTLLGCLKTLLRQAQARGRKDSRKKCSLTLPDMISMYKNQGGLCAYSGMTLQHQRGDWHMSLERIDVRIIKTYSVDNVCLVCQEFNGTDLSSLNSEKDVGGGGWSSSKILFVRSAGQEDF